MPMPGDSDERDTSAAMTNSTVRGGVLWGGYLAISTLIMVVLLTQTVAAASNSVKGATSSQNSAASFPFGTPPSVTARAAYLIDADTGLVLYSKDANQELPQASCTKVMTALVAIEQAPLTKVITAGPDAHALVNPDSSYMGLDVGEKLTLKDLLYGMILPSGNDAAVAIADGIAGSVPAFAALMNAKAKQLGLTHTHFVNPNGLPDDGHYTSARDLAVLSAVALRNPTFATLVKARTYSIPKTADHKAYNLLTGNDLLPLRISPYPGALGVKPGYTPEAGFCMSFAADRYGHTIVGAVLDDPSWQVRIVDMRTLLDWGFIQEGIPAAQSPTPWAPPVGH